MNAAEIALGVIVVMGIAGYVGGSLSGRCRHRWHGVIDEIGQAGWMRECSKCRSRQRKELNTPTGPVWGVVVKKGVIPPDNMSMKMVKEYKKKQQRR